FAHDALAEIRDLGLPVIVAGTASGDVRDNRYFRSLARCFNAALVDQGPGSLGIRMAQVIAPFARDGVVLIGTDTPSLPASAIKRACSLIQHNRVVLGPSLDGGYYLVGIHGDVPDMFRGIRWGRSCVLRETLARLARFEIQPALAPVWYDVDHWDDLMVLTEHLRRIARRDALPCPETARVLTQLGLLPTCR